MKVWALLMLAGPSLASAAPAPRTACAPGFTAQDAVLRAELQAARSRWAQADIQKYSLTLERLLQPEPSETLYVRVQDGHARSAPEAAGDIASVEDLFALADELIDTAVPLSLCVRALYGRTYGYPLVLEVGSSEPGVQHRASWFVRFFRRE